MDLALEDIGKTAWANQAILDAKEVGRSYQMKKKKKKRERVKGDSQETREEFYSLNSDLVEYAMPSHVITYIRNHQWSDALYRKMAKRELPALELLKPGMQLACLFHTP